MKIDSPKRILVIEDEEHIAEGIKINLVQKGYDVSIAANGVAGIEKWKEWCPDLIVLDIMLPGIDGLSLLQSIRLEDQQLPVLILSARSDADDRVKGLSSGGDDYMTKPFNLEEFLLRVDRMLERTKWYDQDNGAESSKGIGRHYVFGANRIDFEKSLAFCRAGRVALTGQEVKLLKLFITNKGKPLSRKKLLEIGWGYTGITKTRTIDNFIVRFRKYFEENPKKPIYFKSVRSIGYVFNP
jgi:two-component system, OmpR family, alkaline phosphatase synthesis response regulator PhoP